MKISVVIPAYNESENINTTIDEFTIILEQTSTEHEIIVVDDHSDDDTYEKAASHRTRNCKVIRLSRRSGSHVAIRAGLLYASGDCVLVISADGQEPAKTLEIMLLKWKEGNQIIWALRNSRNDEGLLSRIFAFTFYKTLTALSEMPSSINLARADFYLLDRAVVNALNQCSERNTSLFGLIVWIGFKQTSVNYERLPRRFGESGWSLHARLRLAKDWIIAFSSLPLRAITYLGFLIASIGFIYATMIIINSIAYGTATQGWASMITTGLILGGAQMIMLGIIGEYLARCFDETRRRPVFFVEESTQNLNT